MGSESPDVVLYDNSGNALAVQSGSATPTSTPALMVAGSDGTNSRYVVVDTSGRQLVVGAGTAGSPAGGVVTIQGIASGTTVPVSGTITANAGTGNFTVIQGTASNLNATVVGTGSDNTANSTTKLPVLAAVANTSAPSYTSGNMVPLSVDTSGNLRITGSISASNPSVGTTGSTAPTSATEIGGIDGSGNLQSPKVDNITGQTIKQLSTASTITSPGGQSAGIFAYVNAYGTLRVSPEGTTLFSDIFDGAVIDTNKWTTTVTSGGSVTQSGGLAIINAGTTASASAILNGVPTFANYGLSFSAWGCTAQFTGPATGTYRFIGMGTNNGSIPTDAIGFEYDTSGNLYAVIYASGTNVYRSSALTSPGTSFNRYGFHFRTDLVLFYYVTTEYPVASSSFVTPNVQTLPPQAFIKNGGATLGSNAVCNIQGVGISDDGKNQVQLSDSTYQWRKATIKPASTAAVATDPALVVAISPNNSLTVSNPSVGSTGATTPTSATLAGGAVTTSAPTYTTGQMNALSLTTGGALRVSSNNIIETNYGTNGQSITCTLASLANNGQRQSTAVTNTLYDDVLVQVKIKTGTSGVSATGIVNIYAYGTVDNGTTYGDTVTGTDGAVTLTSPPNLRLIGTINAVANATTYKSNPMSLVTAFDGRVPQKWGIVVENKTGAALDSTAGNFSSLYQGINYSLV